MFIEGTAATARLLQGRQVNGITRYHCLGVLKRSRGCSNTSAAGYIITPQTSLQTWRICDPQETSRWLHHITQIQLQVIQNLPVLLTSTLLLHLQYAFVGEIKPCTSEVPELPGPWQGGDQGAHGSQGAPRTKNQPLETNKWLLSANKKSH